MQQCKSLRSSRPQSWNFTKKRHQHNCLPMNFVKFLRTPFFTEHLRWLLLKTDATNLVVLPLSSEDEDKKLTQTDSTNEFTIHDLWFTQVNPKKSGWDGQFDRATCGFSKNIASIEKVKPRFLWLLILL